MRSLAKTLSGLLCLLVSAFMAFFTYLMWWCAADPLTTTDGARLGAVMVLLCSTVTLAYAYVSVHLLLGRPFN
jgi:hypothetical protein